MAVAKPVWPLTYPIEPVASFVVLLIAEGYTAAQEDDFANLCAGFCAELLDTAPFGMLRARRERISIWRLFVASAQPGPAVGTVPGNTVLGSTYDPATGQLSLSGAALTDLLNASTLGSASVPSALGYLSIGLYDRRGLVTVLMPPPVVGGTPVIADLDADQNLDAPDPPNYIAATTAAGWENVVLRGLVRGLGLGDEFDTVHAGQPDASTAFALDTAPNLIAGTLPDPASPPTGQFKWFAELDKSAVAVPLAVIPYGQQPPPGTPAIALFEGAGGYQNGVYRSAADCFLRRRIGAATSAADGGTPRGGDVVFCELCKRALIRAIGSLSPEPQPSFLRQRLEFDQVTNWTTNKVVTSFPFRNSFTGQTTRPAPWWEFNLAAGPAIDTSYDGLLITNLVLQGQGAQSHAMPPVAQRIEFRDIAAVLDDGTVAPFDFGTAFSAAQSPVLEIHTDGELSATDKNVLYGIRLTLNGNLNGRCPVTLELSLALKGAMIGFDPVDAAYSCKFYPQIALTWHKGGTNAVKRFRGAVRMVFNNQAMLMGGGTSTSTVASFFTDSTAPLPLLRRSQVRDGSSQPGLLPAAPVWSLLFDYYKPNLQLETEVTGVYGPLSDAGKRDPRQIPDFPWPPPATLPAGSSGGHLMFAKVPDQACYDNLHVHGSMGPDPVAPSGPMVHAPGCAEACIHLHWRWGAVAGLPNPDHYISGLTRFWGWSRATRGDSEPHSALSRPLIPGNQDLTVAVAHPSTVRSDPMGPVIQQPGVALDPAVKAVWYTVDISGTLPAERRQVILEQGGTFAFRYNWDTSVTLKKWVAWLRGLPYLQQGLSDEDTLHLGYPYLRWFLDSTGTPFSAQVPTGDFTPPAESTPLESI